MNVCYKNVFVFRLNLETGIVTPKLMCNMLMEVNICYDPSGVISMPFLD
jgi:hypothetical protein